MYETKIQNNVGVSAGGDGQVHVWSFSSDWSEQNSEKPLLRLNCHQSVVTQLDINQSELVLSASADQTALIHDLNSGLQMNSLVHMAPLSTASINHFKNFEVVTGQEVSDLP